MKKLNPLIEMGWRPLTDSSEYNKQIKLIKESEFLCNIVEIGMNLLEEECSYENTSNNKLKFQSSLEAAFNRIPEEKQKFGYEYDIFHEEFMTNLKNKSALQIYMAAMIYLSELKNISLYRDIHSEGNPDTTEKSVALEKIKDKHRYIMINKFVSLEKSNLLTLNEILFQTLNYMLNVRIEFEVEYES